MRIAAKTVTLGSIVLALVLLLTACAPQVVKEEVKVEVTRQVEVTREVPVTKEVVKEVVTTIEPPKPWEQAAEFIPTSLHGTTAGMGYFYSKEQGGFETLTNVPYEQLPCKNCHTLYNKGDKVGQPRCEGCHINEEYAPVQAAVKLPQFAESGPSGCLSCHRRQGFEYTKTTVVLDENGKPVTDPVKGTPYEVPAITDVHRSPPPNGKGLACVNCHDETQTHGDGTVYNNLFDSPNTQCSTCHQLETLSKNPAHETHGENMTCAACHAATVVSCQGCHLNEVIAGGPEYPNARVFGWKFLIKNNEGKIELGNLMTAVHTDETDTANPVRTIAVLSPYYDHSMRSFKGKDINAVCAECHNNPTVKTYNETGKIVISQWDEKAGKMVYPTKGVVPIPPDYKTAFQMAIPYITNIDEVIAAVKAGKPQAEIEALTKWALGDTAPDMWQMNYGTPLDKMPVQMEFNLPTPTPAPK